MGLGARRDQKDRTMRTRFSGYGPQPRAWQGIVLTGLRGVAGTMRFTGRCATYARFSLEHSLEERLVKAAVAL